MNKYSELNNNKYITNKNGKKIDISLFDYKFYTTNYTDIKNLSYNQAIVHYINHGYYEGRLIYLKSTVLKGKNEEKIDISSFDYKFYTTNYTDLKDFSYIQAIIHYINYGYYEGRLIHPKSTTQKSKFEKYKYMYNEMIPDYDHKLELFLKENNITNDHYYNNTNWQFRYFCYYYTPYMRNINLPILKYGNKYEAVFIEFRILPNIEFLLRNTIDKLGQNWSHTIICGNLNHEFFKLMRDKINRKIRIIKLEYDNIDASTYSQILTKKSFWENFRCDRILLYQEDSIIFNQNIINFIDYSYVGAPWPNININKLDVGNGGFSLRDPKVMIDVINKVKVEDTDFSCVQTYINSKKLTYPPEDVYFSNNIINFDLGSIPNKDIASYFSSESIFNPESFGGHQIWLNNTDWKEFLERKLIHKSKPTFSSYYNDLAHYGGMKDMNQIMCNNLLHDTQYDQYFLDTVERFFLFDNQTILKEQWSGIIHLCPLKNDSTLWLKKSNILNMFKNKKYIESMKYCKYLITMSNDLKKYIVDELQKLNTDIPVYVLKHPITYTGKYYFNFDKFLKNTDKKILQIGQQYRRLSSIFKLNSDYSKYWLTGDKSMTVSNINLERWLTYKNENVDKNTVKILYTDTKEEYDYLLSENIVFLDLYAASANNAVLESIVRNTPIVVNKLEAVVEYLGDEYPLYYETLDEVDALIMNNDKILEAHLYLKNMNKDDISYEHFIREFININHEHK